MSMDIIDESGSCSENGLIPNTFKEEIAENNDEVNNSTTQLQNSEA